MKTIMLIGQKPESIEVSVDKKPVSLMLLPNVAKEVEDKVCAAIKENYKHLRLQISDAPKPKAKKTEAKKAPPPAKPETKPPAKPETKTEPEKTDKTPVRGKVEDGDK